MTRTRSGVIPVSAAGASIDVSDRDARLLGRVKLLDPAGLWVIITSTNLPGGPAWTTEQLASAAGSVVRVIDYKPTTPLRSAVVNTATTIVAPLQLQTIWRGNVSYFTAA